MQMMRRFLWAVGVKLSPLLWIVLVMWAAAIDVLQPERVKQRLAKRRALEAWEREHLR